MLLRFFSHIVTHLCANRQRIANILYIALTHCQDSMFISRNRKSLIRPTPSGSYLLSAWQAAKKAAGEGNTAFPASRNFRLPLGHYSMREARVAAGTPDLDHSIMIPGRDARLTRS
jgi:hypothetical protein